MSCIIHNESKIYSKLNLVIILMPKIASRKHYIIGGALVMLSAVGLYGLLPRFGDFADSLQILSSANPWLVVLAAGASLLSVICSAIIYTILAPRRLHLGDTLLVQLSGLLINRILPAGIGGLGLNYLYLRARRHSVSQATAVVTLNNTVGFTGHILLTMGLVLLLPAAFKNTSLPSYWLTLTVAVLLVLCLGVLALWHLKPSFFKSLKSVTRYYAQRPQRLLLSVSVSLLLTLSNVLSLWLSCLALDVSISFLAIFVAFTFGVVIGTATPTPGGLGGVEAGLVGALAVQGVPTSTALAVALLYRLVSYWFGLSVGAVASLVVARRGLLRYHN